MSARAALPPRLIGTVASIVAAIRAASPPAPKPQLQLQPIPLTA